MRVRITFSFTMSSATTGVTRAGRCPIGARFIAYRFAPGSTRSRAGNRLTTLTYSVRIHPCWRFLPKSFTWDRRHYWVPVVNDDWNEVSAPPSKSKIAVVSCSEYFVDVLSGVLAVMVTAVPS